MKLTQNKTLNENGYFIQTMFSDKDSGQLRVVYEHETLPIKIAFHRINIFSQLVVDVVYGDCHIGMDSSLKHSFSMDVIKGINQVINDIKYAEDVPVERQNI